MRHLAKNKHFFTTSELADMLGISTVAVFKRIQKEQIKAQKHGRAYLIDRDEVQRILNIGVSEDDKEKIKKAVQKTIDEYGIVLKMLGKE